jgi:hypothetical protein
MIRVLVADTPEALRAVRAFGSACGGKWDAVIAPSDSHSTWSEFGPCRSLEAGRSLLLSQPAEIVCAAVDASLLSLVSSALGAGSSLTLLPDARQTADWAYSLFPIAEESPDRAHPWFADRQDPAVQSLRRLVAAGRLGECRHAAWETALAAQEISKSDVERRLLRDIDLLRSVFGEYDQLTAIPVAASDESVLTQTVTLTGRSLPTVTWTIRADDSPSRRLIVTATNGRATLSESHDGVQSLEISPAALSQDFPEPAATSPPADWHDLLRAFDYVAAARRSIRRRRAIDLRAEAISEKAQFKTLMSATGCGLLVWTLLGVVFMLVGASVLDPRDSLQRHSEAAGLVLWSETFDPASGKFAAPDATFIGELASTMRQSSLPVLIEKSNPPDDRLDASRRSTVVEALSAKGVPAAASRVELHDLRGRLFARVVTVGWVLLFLPLGLFLLVQALVVVAREPRPPSDSA